MTEFEGRHDVAYGSVTVGAVNITKNGLMMKIDCICLNSPRGIMRLVGVSGDQAMSFGILIPDGDRLRLTRSFSKNDLRPLENHPVAFCIVPADIDIRTLAESPASEAEAQEPTEPEKAPAPALEPAEAAEVAPVPDIPEAPPVRVCDWREMQSPSSLFSDPELRVICAGITGALYREESGAGFLAVPVSDDRPFPLMPVFCCGEPESIDGREYVVFKILGGRLCASDE